MQYLRLEQKLNDLAGYGLIDGPFYGWAGAFQNIFVDKKLSPEERVDRLIKVIEDALKDWRGRSKNDLQVLTVEDYMKATGKSRSTIGRWLKKNKIPNAHKIGEGKNAKWIILSKT